MRELDVRFVRKKSLHYYECIDFSVGIHAGSQCDGFQCDSDRTNRKDITGDSLMFEFDAFAGSREEHGVLSDFIAETHRRRCKWMESAWGASSVNGFRNGFRSATWRIDFLCVMHFFDVNVPFVW